jgi:hypothetical protein
MSAVPLSRPIRGTGNQIPGQANQAIEIAEASAGIVMRRLGLILAARLAGIAMLHPLRSG